MTEEDNPAQGVDMQFPALMPTRRKRHRAGTVKLSLSGSRRSYAGMACIYVDDAIRAIRSIKLSAWAEMDDAARALLYRDVFKEIGATDADEIERVVDAFVDATDNLFVDMQRKKTRDEAEAKAHAARENFLRRQYEKREKYRQRHAVEPWAAARKKPSVAQYTEYLLVWTAARVSEAEICDRLGIKSDDKELLRRLFNQCGILPWWKERKPKQPKLRRLKLRKLGRIDATEPTDPPRGEWVG